MRVQLWSYTATDIFDKQTWQGTAKENAAHIHRICERFDLPTTEMQWSKPADRAYKTHTFMRQPYDVIEFNLLDSNDEEAVTSKRMGVYGLFAQ